MVEISLDRCDGGRYIFSAKGHSEMKRDGGDIVCAAISALVYNFYLAICKLDTNGEISKYYHSMDKGEALLDFTVKKRFIAEFELISEILMDGFCAVAEYYPDNVIVL